MTAIFLMLVHKLEKHDNVYIPLNMSTLKTTGPTELFKSWIALSSG